MILEGIVTTINEDGSTNVSPMGPVVDDGMQQLTLRPFQTSTTYQNLHRLRRGVFHVTDDAELIARAAVSNVSSQVRILDNEDPRGRILADACRWYAFRVENLDQVQEIMTRKNYYDRV